jgi:hypothetical protein
MPFRARPRGPRPRFLLRIESLESRIVPASLIAISDAGIAEGDSGSVMMDFEVSRSGDLTAPVTVGYATADGTAQAGIDYTAEAGTVTIPAGSSSATIAIPVLGNLLLQPDRTFSVTLTGVDGGTPSGGLGAQQPFATGSGPFALAPGDFNSDGRPDLVVANDSDNTVSILLNTTAPGAPTPSFAPAQDFATDPDPISVVVGDFNLDGKPDLAIVEQGSGLVSIRLNTTAPGAATATFAPGQDFSTGLGPVSAAVADFNGDGEPDLAIANQFSSSVSVLVNTTPAGADTATFAAKRNFATGAFPNSVAVGDFNGDGMPDLAVADVGSNKVSVLLNATALGSVTPSLAPRKDFGTDSAPNAVAVGDLNGDGMPDLAVTNFFSNSVSVLLNTAAAGASTPAFAAKQDFATGSFADAVAIGDFNADAVPDLVIANSNANSVSLLENTTAPGAPVPSFAASQDFTTGAEPAALALADFNGDGEADVAVANFSSNTISVLPNAAGPAVTIARATAVGLILDDDSPAAIVPASGDNQTAILGATFADPLAVRVFNANGHAVQGVTVTFAAPFGGAGGTFSGGASSVTAITDANGLASAGAFASSATAGGFTVTAQAAGLATTVDFHLAIIYGIDTSADPSKAKRSGSTIAEKVEITDAAGNDVGALGLQVQALYVVDQDVNPVALQSPGNANPGNLFQFDPRTGLYQFNIKTTGYSAGTYWLYFEVGDDPSVHSLSFAVS